ncbi:MAG: protein kinase [Propionibacteriaceae bacterium]|jgi:serine/threonine-protein kinase PknG|nr:protein kinase [Propionibacteriaceae bacterium]
MKCLQPGCKGRIVDGYCDICGMPPAAGAALAPSKPAAQPAPSGKASGRCPMPGCNGRIIDGYCDVCGSPPATARPAAASAPDAAPTKASAALGSIALGSTLATSFGGRVERRRRRAKQASRMGIGLTTVPSAPAIDPAKAVMADPQVPEDKRVCPKCGSKVGQSSEADAGRSDGFCPKCGAEYSFSVKLKPGLVINRQYKVEGVLAHGGQGWIYLARDMQVSGRWVVLKGLLNAGDEDALAAAINERQYLARVGIHSQIVEIYNFIENFRGADYIVMEYVGGRSLKQLLKQRMESNGGVYDPLPPDQALAFLIEILPALSYLHDTGLLYCDFKPDNVIQVGDTLRLIDLGGVRPIDDDESPIFGTRGYQAPEVATDGASIASDIFTVGRTLMVLCANVPGYQSGYEFSIPPASDMPAFAANDSLYRLLERCCAIDPNDRFTSIEEVRRQMMGVLREVVSATRPQSSTSQASPNFLPPTGLGESPVWELLPELRVDEDDPAAGWLAQISTTDPKAQLRALSKPPQETTQVLLARARAAISADIPKTVADCVQKLQAADPWEWRAAWLTGLSALKAGNAKAFKDAQAAFNTVYGYLPGELAPKLALGLACELGGELDIAERMYRICVLSDAAYVTPAAFGLARVCAARKDVAGMSKALSLVPATSRAYPEAIRTRVHYLVALNQDPARLEDVFNAVEVAPLDAYEKATYQERLLQSALNQPNASLGKIAPTKTAVRTRLEQVLRARAAATNDPAERAQCIERANKLRPWSVI